MRIIGESPSVNEWREHYLSMVKGERKRKPTAIRGRGQVHTYLISKKQSGSGIANPIKVISPVEANVEQAKKLIEREAVKRKRTTSSLTRDKRKRINKRRKVGKGVSKGARKGVRKGHHKGSHKGVRKRGSKGKKKKYQVKSQRKSDIFS